MESLLNLAKEKPVVVFSKSSCCMSHSIKYLIGGYGAYTEVHELDQHPRGGELQQILTALGCDPVVPTVFIGGKLIGGANAVIDVHMRGKLKALLTEAKAIHL